MGRRFAVHAGPHRQALIALAIACSTASAAPKGKAAKAQFEAGVAAYKANNYADASAAFGKSFSLEADVETMFAWAQAERKQSHCDKASELYVRLLAMKLPAANKTVVRGQLDECKRIIADDRAKSDADARAAADAKIAADQRALAEANAAKAAADANAKAAEVAPPERAVQPPLPPPTPAAKPWFKDPLGDTLVIVGVIGLGVGGAMLSSAHAAQQASKSAPDVAMFKMLDDKATSRGTIGVIAGLGGVALVVAGVVRYATRSSGESTTVTGWLDGHASGLALTGQF